MDRKGQQYQLAWLRHGRKRHRDIEAVPDPPVIVRLADDLNLTLAIRGEPVVGRTVSGVRTSGRRSRWLLFGDLPSLRILDTIWSSGERDIVFGRQDADATLPPELAALQGRKRVSVEGIGHDGWWRMTIQTVMFDDEGWPHWRWCTYPELERACGHALLVRLREIGVTRIGTKEMVHADTGRNRSQLCAMGADASGPAPVATYAATMVVPLLRQAARPRA